MTANFILGFVTGLPIGLAAGYLLMAAIAHQRRKAAERRVNDWLYADRLANPIDEPTELGQYPDDFDSGRQTK